MAWRYVHDLGVAALNHLGIALWHAGQIDRSLGYERQALAVAEHLHHDNSMGYALFYCGALSAFRRRDFGELQRLAGHAHAHARDRKLPHWSQFGMCLEGVGRATAGDVEGGIALIQEGIRTCERADSRAFRPAFLAGLAEAQLMAGRLDEAEQTIDSALHLTEQTSERWMDAELWRLKAQTLALSDRHKPERVEALLQQAADCAKHQGSRPLHLRAVISLARLCRDQGRHAEAYKLLAPIYGWFTEGFDTPDLKDAKALLDEIRG